MRRRLKKLIGITTAAAMAVSLVPTTVFAEEPATDWQTQSLAIGNGYMGSLVFGGINKDKIHINEKTV